MENNKELLTEILKRVQRNYVRVVEIERLTRELGDTLSRNDQESAQLLVKMRQQEMDQVGETKQEIQMLLQSVNAEEREKIKGWLAGNGKEQPVDFEAKKILEISSMSVQILERTIGIDKAINKKIAGKDSFYNK